MRSKLFSFIAFGILTIFLVGLASALTLSPTSLDFTYEGQSQTVTITGNISSITVGQDSSSVFTVSETSSGIFNIILNFGSLPSYISKNEEIVSFNDTSPDTKNLTLTYINSFCEEGDQNDSKLTLNVNVENKGQGEDDEWLPLDTIEVEVELENEGEDLEDVVFELGLFEKDSGKNIAKDMSWISDDDEEYEYGDIDEDEDGDHTFEFRINPEEIDEDNYLLMVKAYPSGEEEDVCIDYSGDLSNTYFEDIKIEREGDSDKMVVIDEETLPEPIEASCGQQVTFTAEVYNIGDKDFEDQIMVTLYNKELGLDLKKVALGDLDAGEKTEVSFTFEVPQNSEEEQYPLYMRTFYDYDEDDGKYEEDYDKRSDDTFIVSLRVSDCFAEPEVSVSATLESGAKVGEEMKIKIILGNLGSDTRTFMVDVENYGAWAELSESPGTLTLNSGSSGETYVNLDVDKDASSGEKTFNILVYEGTELIKTQPISVNIESRNFLGITGFSINEGNGYLWGLGLLNVILVIVIIIVAVRVARRK